MTPEVGDDAADLLGPPDDAQLRDWSKKLRRTLWYAGWQDSGNTGARLIAVHANPGGKPQKLIMKYVPKGHRETEEPGRHTDAWDSSPADFKARHLVRQVWDPVMLPGGGWVMFQEVAAHDLTRVQSMSARLLQAIESGSPVADITKAVKVAVTAALGEWNSDGVETLFPPTGEHLQALLGERLKSEHPMCRWAYDRGLLTGPGLQPTTTGVEDTPNPYALVLGTLPASSRRLHVMSGRTHGDLHPGNILLGPDPTQFWFIDLSRFNRNWPLTFDPAYLLLTTTAHFLPSLEGDRMRSAAIEVLLDPEKSQESWLPAPYHNLVTAIHGAAESWADQASLAEEWRTATLLSYVAGGLIMSGRDVISDRDRDWFLRLAAAAAGRYTGLGESVSLPRAVPVRPSGPAEYVNAERPGRLGFAELIAERTRNFTGRQWAIERIDKIMADPNFPSGYLLVLGEPGSGKTTLLSRLVQIRGYIHHFNIAGIRSSDTFYGNVCAQLSARYGLFEGPLPYDPAGRTQHLLGLLTAALRQAGRLVVVVDALDESEMPGTALSTYWLALPPALPEGVHFVLSSRELAAYHLPPGFEPLRLGGLDNPDNRRDIHDYISQQIDNHREALTPRIEQWGETEEDFCDILTERSTGNFMYAVHILRDIRAGLLSKDNIDNVRDLPSGLRAYYERHWSTMRSRDEALMGTLYEPVLKILAVAREPVNVDFLATHSNLTTTQVIKVLRDWWQFLTDVPVGDDLRYRFYHASFRDFLAEQGLGLSGTRRDVIANALSTLPGYPGSDWESGP